MQDVFLEQDFKPPSPQNDCDSDSDSGAEVEIEDRCLMYLVSSVLFLDVKFD